MSIKLMSLVWELDLPPGEKLVLLALADQANDAGVQCWPSVATIAKRSGQGERTVRRALADLEKLGHLTRNHRDGNSTQYEVHPCHSGTPAKKAPLPNTPKTPAKLAGKPSRNTKLPKKKTSLDARATRVPADFAPIMSGKTASVVAGWPPGRFSDELEHFIDHHTAKGTHSYNWQASWRTWVKNSKKWEGQNGRSHTNGLRGNRPDPALDMLRRAQAELAAAGDSELDRPAWPALPAIGASGP